jgi:large subunit ribosomal protein L24
MPMGKYKKAVEQIHKPQIKKGDEVIVICGKDRGRRGKVISVDAKKQKCVVEKINEYKKHQKPKQTAGKQRMAGGIITVAMPIHLSNVMVIDKTTHKPTRVGRKLVGTKRLRYSKLSGQLIDAE